MSRIRIGVIGCGAIAQVHHLPNLTALHRASYMTYFRRSTNRLPQTTRSNGRAATNLLFLKVKRLPSPRAHRRVLHHIRARSYHVFPIHTLPCLSLSTSMSVISYLSLSVTSWNQMCGFSTRT